ncbi:hypothetical protein E3N88_35695 [Mikania micrantha]|uniref:Uncharacterized protein n=1 Tax=Mikania micrantha TaxID=192012 RepID=A0A5N6M1N9_9ASTR|nr:hypothetical protein E3N88_35695 [Mikania micrantha]
MVNLLLTIDLASPVPTLKYYSAFVNTLGLRVLDPIKRTNGFDIYKNIEKVSLQNSLFLVIHVRTITMVSRQRKWYVTPGYPFAAYV